MSTRQTLDNILQILYTMKEDKNKLDKILQFLEDEIYEEPEAQEEIEIPERFKNVVSQIADSINAGFICYLNPETLETEEILRRNLFDQEAFGTSDDDPDAEISSQHDDWVKCISFEPLESNESFQIMEQFAEKLDDNKLQGKLLNALTQRKPFANFKYIIDNSFHRQDWFDFKKHWLENYVSEILMLQIDDETESPSEVINGFYNDDGTKIDPESVPVPGLCVICKTHQSDDWEDNLLCLMNRYDQRNVTSFNCGTFEKI